jgi:hypothetical protein
MKELMKKTLVLAGLCAAQFTLQGCLQESSEAGKAPGDLSGAVKEDFRLEEAFPGRTGVLASGFFQGRYIEYEIIDGQNVFQGDMIIPDEDISQTPPSLSKETGAGRTSAARKWPGGVVPYTIEAGMPNQARVTAAIDNWSAKFTFVARTNQADYITFRDGGGGCNSWVGRQGGRQDVNLGAGCTTGNAIHETGHALGLYHEMSRSNRDNDITINWNNIEAGKSHNFNTYTADGDDGFDWLGLDFNSVMMYPSTAFGKVVNGVTLTTISAKDGRSWTAQRSGPSAGDMRTVEAMYPSANPSWTGVAAHTGNNLDVVVGRGDGSIFTAAWDKNVSNGAWRGWWNVAGGFTSAGGPVSMVSRGSSKLDVFTNGTDNRVYTAAWDHFVANGVWRGWWVIGSLTTWPGSNIVPTARQLGKMEVFAVGRDGRVNVAVWDTNLPNGGWKEWAPILGGVAVSGGQLTAAASSSTRLDVYTVGQDGNVYQAYYEGSVSNNWNGWFSIGNPGVGVTNVQMIARGTNKFDLFAVGLNRAIYHRSWDNGWKPWAQVLGGVAAAGSRIVATSRNPTTLDIFAIGTDNRVYSAAKADGGAWGGWWALDGQVRPGSQLSAISRGTDKLDVFCTGTDGGTYNRAWDGSWKPWVRLP